MGERKVGKKDFSYIPSKGGGLIEKGSTAKVSSTSCARHLFGMERSGRRPKRKHWGGARWAKFPVHIGVEVRWWDSIRLSRCSAGSDYDISQTKTEKIKWVGRKMEALRLLLRLNPTAEVKKIGGQEANEKVRVGLPPREFSHRAMGRSGLAARSKKSRFKFSDSPRTGGCRNAEDLFTGT